MGEVVRLKCVTTLDLDPDVVLEEAVGCLKGVVIMGYLKEDDTEYFASSIADGSDILWLMERMKNQLLKIVDDP